MWQPYVTPTVGYEAIRNYNISLAACTPRIRLLQEDRAEEIVANIQVQPPM